MRQRPFLLIDATCATDRLTGFERYTRDITRNLLKLVSERQLGLLVLLAREASWLTDAGPSATVLYSPFTQKIATEQFWIPRVVARAKPAVSFFPGFPPSPLIRLHPTKVIKTVYDGVLWNRSDTVSLKAKLYFKPLETFGMSYYDVVHTISASSAQELSRLFPNIAARIINSGIGTDISKYQKTLAKDRAQDLRLRYQLPEHFLLTVGTIEPRKNLPFLLRVIARLKRSRPEIHLVVVGRHGWGTEAFMKTLRELELTAQVSILGALDDDDLPAIYRLADVFLFPSLHEGFGLPIVEAMASGTPVVASNTTSIPEAAGNAALLLSPVDEDAWVKSIQDVLDDASLAQRLRELGRTQAAKFSWQEVANKVLDSALAVTAAHPGG